MTCNYNYTFKTPKGLWKGGKKPISFFDYIQSKCRKQVSDISLQYRKSIELNKKKKKKKVVQAHYLKKDNSLYMKLKKSAGDS